MRFEKPFVRAHPAGGTDEALRVRAAIRQPAADVIEHAHAPMRERRRVGERQRLRARHRLGRRLITLRVLQPLLLGQRALGEETEIGIALIHQHRAGMHGIVEELNNHAGRARRAGQLDANRERAHTGKHRHKLGGSAAQIAERHINLAGQGRAHVGRQPAARLQGNFEQHRERHVALPVVGEIPRIGRHIVLRFHRAARHDLPRLGLYVRDAVNELERRAGQARNHAAFIENFIGRTERIRRLAGGEGEDAVVVIQGGLLAGRNLFRHNARWCRAACARCRCRTTRPRPQRAHGLARHTAIAQAHVGNRHNRFAIGIHQRVGNHIRLRPVANLLDRHFVGHHLGRIEHLATALQGAGHAWHWLQRHLPLLCHPALAQQQHAQRMQAALEHQGAGHHAVIDKVAGEKPVVRMNISLAAHQP